MNEKRGVATYPSARSEEKISRTGDFEPDLPPMTAAELENAPRRPRVKTLRRALRLTQEEFSARYGIPLGTIRGWEQGVTEPDATAKSYLRAIAGNAQAVYDALHFIPEIPTG
jgi:putative transcriptional regulator